MTIGDLIEKMSQAGAPLEAVLLAVRALEAKQAEIDAIEDVRLQKRAAEAARKRAARNADNPRTIRGHSEDCPADSSPLVPPKEKSPTPPKEITPLNPPTATKRARATRLPADWLIPPDWIEDATRLGFSEAEARNEADRFRDYWIARGGEAAAKLDWRATWRNWCRNANERRPRAPHANGGSRGGYGKPVDPVEIRNRIQRELADREALPGDGRQLRSVGVG